MNFTIGQLVEVDHKGNTSWEYGVVLNLFDNSTEIQLEYGGHLMYQHSSENISEDDNDWFNQNIRVRELRVNGQIVMAKKRLLGGYKFR